MELKGRVIWASTSNRVSDASISIRNVRNNEKKPILETDEDGNFEVVLEEGEWTVTILHAEGRQVGVETLKVPIDPKSEADSRVEFKISSLTHSVNQKVGGVFFAGLILLLFVLIGGWVWAHLVYPDPRPPSVAANVLNLSAEAQQVLIDTEKVVENAALSKIMANMERQLNLSSAQGNLKKEIQELSGQVNSLKRKLLPTSDRALRALKELEAAVKLAKSDSRKADLDLISNARKSLTDGTNPDKSKPLANVIKKLEESGFKDAVLEKTFLERLRLLVADSGAQAMDFGEALNKLESKLPNLAKAEAAAAKFGSSSLIWFSGYKIYLEILFWALFGTLVRLIFVVHQYLRWNRFLIQGIYQHIAFLITVPILSLIFISVISMAKLTSDDSSVVLDFSDPRIIAGGSFLIALVPWRLWERLLGTARTIVGTKDGEG